MAPPFANPILSAKVLAGRSKLDGMQTTFEAELEVIQARYAEIASELRCPHHQVGAKVVVDGESLAALDVDVFCCCGLMEQRVRLALQEEEHQHQLAPQQPPSIGLRSQPNTLHPPEFSRAA